MSETSLSGDRFYDVVDVVGVDGGYGITLDKHPVPTPLGKTLVLPAKALAEAVAEEWRAQKKSVDPRSMLLSGLANTAIDRTEARRTAVIEEALSFAATDLLCYRTEAPDDLACRQHDCWQPLLDWAEATLDVRFKTTTGLLPVSQPPQNADILKLRLQGLCDMELTAIATLAAAMSSLILALAVAEGRIDAEAAFEAAQLDENYQNEHWGHDDEADARQQNLRTDITAAAKFITLVRSLV